MSRGQSTQAFNTSSNENATDFGNAQSAFGSTQNAIGNYNNQLANFVSGNPYTPGGEYDQTINTGLANVSDASSNSLRGALHPRLDLPRRGLSDARRLLPAGAAHHVDCAIHHALAWSIAQSTCSGQAVAAGRGWVRPGT